MELQKNGLPIGAEQFEAKILNEARLRIARLDRNRTALLATVKTAKEQMKYVAIGLSNEASPNSQQSMDYLLHAMQELDAAIAQAEAEC
jgi:hypothetical protein